MNELIKIENQDGKETVNARNLYEFLEVGRDFSNWIRDRIKKYDFIESQDFTTILAKSNGGRPSIEYFISIDMAKELSMVENNEKGRQARRYFIECEKKAKAISLPQNFAQALRLAADQQEKIEAQKKLLVEQKPKVEFAEAVMESSTTFDMGKVAKILNIDGLGRNNLITFLRGKGILQKNNAPYQRYVDRGYFKIVESKYYVNNEPKVGHKTVAFQKGIDYIRKIVTNGNN